MAQIHGLRPSTRFLVDERIVTTLSLSSHSTVTTWGVLLCSYGQALVHRKKQTFLLSYMQTEISERIDISWPKTDVLDLALRRLTVLGLQPTILMWAADNNLYGNRWEQTKKNAETNIISYYQNTRLSPGMTLSAREFTLSYRCWT